jgi:hypothetical protein
MKKIRLGFLILMVLAFAACSPQAQATEAPSTIDEEPTHIPVDLSPAQRAALTALSEKLKVTVDNIKLVSTEAVTWPNGCLGVQKIGVLCTQAEVPGFNIILEADGKQYEMHTNVNGSVVVPFEDSQPVESVEEAVIKQLANNLGLKESDISVISNSEVEFGDACLGVAMPEVTCAQVVTPGRIIVLEANGNQYEYHVSADGARIQPATLALTWKREGGIAGFCDSLTIFRSGEVYGHQCKAQPNGTEGILKEMLSKTELNLFNRLMTKLGQVNIDASDPEGVSDRMSIELNVYGKGSGRLSDADKQELLSMVQSLFQKLFS